MASRRVTRMGGVTVMFSILLFAAVSVPYAESLPHFIHGRPKGGLLGRPAGQWHGKLPPEQWVTQRVDHFNNADGRQQWQQVGRVVAGRGRGRGRARGGEVEL